MRLISVFSAILIGGTAIASSAETIALADAGWKAAFSFKETCLKSRAVGVDAAVSAILAQPGVKEGSSLPAYGGGRPMRTFADGKVEYLIRYGKKKRFGCFVALGGDPSLAESVKTALSGFEGLQPKPVKLSKKLYYEWSIVGSKDEVRLTPRSDLGSILINLEVN